MKPIYRQLRGYGLDPGFSARLDTAAINEVVYRIPFEEGLQPGPIGEYVEVIDFDPASNSWYNPVDLNDVAVASQLGLDPSEGNPQFHQQFVYAVAMKTIAHFERSLGRKIIWYPRRLKKMKGGRRFEFIEKLRIYPHALREANAYYDSGKSALLFGYFRAADQVRGTNYPGGVVFACLSPDIIAHEMTHAILDSIHHRYLEDTNPDVAAFHEGFADIVSLLQRFTFSDLVEHQLYRADGRLDNYTALGELATQFGEALKDSRGALRSMIGKWNEQGQWEALKPNPNDYRTALDAHSRGALLVATIFDAFQRVYRHTTEDLLRIASSGTGVLPEGRISPDLLRRLAQAASEIAEHLLHICIRALDYCPPNDITLGDYLRALITADLDVAPEDRSGYRVALMEAFRARGIFPERVLTLSVDSLKWDAAQFTPRETKRIDQLAKVLRPRIKELKNIKDRRQFAAESDSICAELKDLLTRKLASGSAAANEALLNKLGLTGKPVAKLFPAMPRGLQFMKNGKPDARHPPNLQVHMIRPAYRAGREGQQVDQVIICITQQVQAIYNGQAIAFRGGCTVVLRSDKDVSIEYVVRKNIRSLERFKRQTAYSLGEETAGLALASTYGSERPSDSLSFKHLHSH